MLSNDVEDVRVGSNHRGVIVHLVCIVFLREHRVHLEAVASGHNHSFGNGGQRQQVGGESVLLFRRHAEAFKDVDGRAAVRRPDTNDPIHWRSFNKRENCNPNQNAQTLG